MVSGTPPSNGDSEPSISAADSVVKETNRISIDYNPVSGRKKLNTYEIIRELGRGEHGRVKLGYDVDKHFYVAIKLLNRKEKPRLGRPQGSSTEEKIHREIAILKKCSHPNIVKLLEVLDDKSSRKIYLVLEYCAKGEIKWQTANGDPALTREQARSVARNVALGLEYLHSNGIIHRDIKPANLLIGGDDVVKISDFGVSYAVSGDASNQSELELAKTVGTPAFFSPELCVPTEFNDTGERKNSNIGSKVDVWAYGVTLYCFLYGELPFEADNEYELFRVIANDEPYFPDPKGDEDLAQANELLKRLLTKDPKQRPTMQEIKTHPWLIKGLSAPSKDEFLHRRNKEAISVSTEEVDEAIKDVDIKSRIKQGLSKIAEHIRPKPRSFSRSSRSSDPNSSRRRFVDLKSSSKYFKNQAPSPSPSPSPSSSPSLSPSPTHARNSITFSEIHKTMGLQENISTYSDDSIIEASPSFTSEGIQSIKIPRDHNRDHNRDHTQEHIRGPVRDVSSDQSLDITTSMTTERQPEGPQPIRSQPGSGIGLMPMSLGDDNSIASSSKGISLENLTIEDLPVTTNNNTRGSLSGTSSLNPLLPELNIPRIDSDSFWDESSSSSDDDDSGELTLVVGRNRTRSIGRQAPQAPQATSTVPNTYN